MAYTDYTLQQLENDFGIRNQVVKLFNEVEPMEPGSWLSDILARGRELPLRSEKAKSELIVMPILMELRNRNDKFFTIYSGESLPVDEKLRGECDFILSKDTHSFDISIPIMQVVEAKKSDIDSGVPQCAAQMIGASKYNQKRGQDINVIYGCVTTGDDWLFMRLTDTIEIDRDKYYIDNLPQILGNFQFILTQFNHN